MFVGLLQGVYTRWLKQELPEFHHDLSAMPFSSNSARIAANSSWQYPKRPHATSSSPAIVMGSSAASRFNNKAKVPSPLLTIRMRVPCLVSFRVRLMPAMLPQKSSDRQSLSRAKPVCSFRKPDFSGMKDGVTAYLHESGVMLNRSTSALPSTILIPAMTKRCCFHSSLVAKPQPIMTKFPLSGLISRRSNERNRG